MQVTHVNFLDFRVDNAGGCITDHVLVQASGLLVGSVCKFEKCNLLGIQLCFGLLYVLSV